MNPDINGTLGTINNNRNKQKKEEWITYQLNNLYDTKNNLFRIQKKANTINLKIVYTNMPLIEIF